MKELSTKASGFLAPSIATPLLVPSFNSGAATATQSGTVITVVFANPHNIPGDAASGISGTGAYVYLRFGTAIFSPLIVDPTVVGNVAGWYGNVTVVGANTITCTAANSQTVSSAQTVTPTASNLVNCTPHGIVIPANSLKAGSQLETKYHAILPGTVAARNLNIRTRNQGATSTSGSLGSTTVSSNSQTGVFFSTLTQFLNSSVDSDFVTSSGSSTVTMRVASTQNIDLTQDFTIINSVVFNGSAANDFAFMLPGFINLVG